MNRPIQFGKSYLFLILFSLFFYACKDDKKSDYVPKVEVRYKNGRAELFRNGLPYHIKGASGTEHLDKVALYAGNSIRTWSLHNAKELLDEAEKHGLTVTLGIEIGRPYWGEDFNYWNIIKVNEKIEELRPYIEAYKDHPALLMWGIGNEVSLKGGNRYLIYYVINQVAKMIKEVDPDHPTMTAINIKTIGRVKYLMSDIDILGYNGFKLIEEFYEENKNYVDEGWGKAYIFTEWGPPGHWEVQDTEWGAPLEMINAEKVYFMKRYWHLMNQDSLAFLGSYAFYWGNKYEITSTWFSHFSEEGLESGSIDFLKSSWQDEPYENSTPSISKILINDKTPELNLYLKADSLYSAKTLVDYQQKDSLKFKWEIRPEESKFYEVDEYQYNMKHLFVNDDADDIEFKTPTNEGAYRLFVFVSDESGKFTSHSYPFYVVTN